jgi:hypothetical protein
MPKSHCIRLAERALKGHRIGGRRSQWGMCDAPFWDAARELRRDTRIIAKEIARMATSYVGGTASSPFSPLSGVSFQTPRIPVPPAVGQAFLRLHKRAHQIAVKKLQWPGATWASTGQPALSCASGVGPTAGPGTPLIVHNFPDFQGSMYLAIASTVGTCRAHLSPVVEGRKGRYGQIPPATFSVGFLALPLILGYFVGNRRS